MPIVASCIVLFLSLFKVMMASKIRTLTVTHHTPEDWTFLIIVNFYQPFNFWALHGCLDNIYFANLLIYLDMNFVLYLYYLIQGWNLKVDLKWWGITWLNINTCENVKHWMWHIDGMTHDTSTDIPALPPNNAIFSGLEKLKYKIRKHSSQSGCLVS